MIYSPDIIYQACESIYTEFHDPRYIHPDPLEIPRQFTNQTDQEISGFFSAMVALGRVDLFMPVVNQIFTTFSQPTDQLALLSYRDILDILKPTYYRFFTTQSLAGLLFGLGKTVKTFGTLESCYLAAPEPTHLGRLCYLRDSILRSIPISVPSITIPNALGVAKRLHLFARWMIRKDAIDLGTWSHGDSQDLYYPLDTHIFQIAKFFSITPRKAPDVTTMSEITEFFRKYLPEDPVKFDFSLARVGLGKGLKNQEYEKTLQKYLE